MPSESTCSVCGRTNPGDARFCMGCGSALGVAAPETRRTVTAVFCDIVGSTSLAEQYDPEILRQALDAYFTTARTIIERHGGRVEKYIGDAVAAVFGVPSAREDDAAHAARAALEIQPVLLLADAPVEADGMVRDGLQTMGPRGVGRRRGGSTGREVAACVAQPGFVGLN